MPAERIPLDNHPAHPDVDAWYSGEIHPDMLRSTPRSETGHSSQHGNARPDRKVNQELLMSQVIKPGTPKGVIELLGVNTEVPHHAPYYTAAVSENSTYGTPKTAPFNILFQTLLGREEIAHEILTVLKASGLIPDGVAIFTTYAITSPLRITVEVTPETPVRESARLKLWVIQ